MIIREYRPSDLEELKAIHNKYFKQEFELPNFLQNYLCAVTLEDEKGIVTIGGIRTLAEVVAVTNKDRSVRSRRAALIEMWQALNYIAAAHNYKELHAFIQDEAWLKQLLNAGFRKTKGLALVSET